MFVYQLTNTKNGKIYVGQTRNPLEHLSASHWKNGFLRRAIIKYGFESFEVNLLATADSLDQLDSFEKFYIALLNTRNPSVGYNIRGGGQRGIYDGRHHKGRRHSNEAKLRMSEAKIGKPKSEKWRASRRKTHCQRGHLLDGENVAISFNGSRVCKQCRIFRTTSQYNAGKPIPTHCKNGHELDETNTRLWRGLRICKECERKRLRKYRGREGGVA